MEDRGFASMERAKHREIASRGGRAAHEGGLKKDGSPRKKGHEWNNETEEARQEASDAGRKGGLSTHQRRRTLELHEVERRCGLSGELNPTEVEATE